MFVAFCMMRWHSIAATQSMQFTGTRGPLACVDPAMIVNPGKDCAFIQVQGSEQLQEMQEMLRPWKLCGEFAVSTYRSRVSRARRRPCASAYT